jgi:hypothetical protein
MADWPLDENGKPMAKVTMGAQEKVPTVQYGNVDLGPASVTRFVPDNPEAIREGLKDCVKACEEIIATERNLVLSSLESRN